MKALLVIGENIFDISGLVQTIEATNQQGETFRGNGVVIYRPNHILGNAPIFLKWIGTTRLLGQEVTTYAVPDNWTALDYVQCQMKADNSKTLISCADQILRKKGIIN